MTEYELVFEVPEVLPFVEMQYAGILHIADHVDPISDPVLPYYLVGFRSVPVTGWLMHSLCVEGEEQMLMRMGVPMEIYIGGDQSVPYLGALLVRRQPVTLVLSHNMKGHHGARVCMSTRADTPDASRGFPEGTVAAASRILNKRKHDA